MFYFINIYFLIPFFVCIPPQPQSTTLSKFPFVSLFTSIPLYPPYLQCWMSAILPPVLLFSGEANGGPSNKGHWPTLPLAVHQSLYSDWLTSRGLVALLFSLTFPANPEVLTCLIAHTYTYNNSYIKETTGLNSVISLNYSSSNLKVYIQYLIQKETAKVLQHKEIVQDLQYQGKLKRQTPLSGNCLCVGSSH